jgi:NAD-dependent dihydropyrimidine dehydrogenase PreA subunit
MKGGARMIFYFSGTGNSRWVAQELADLTGDTAVSIADIVKSGSCPEIAQGQPIGFVFPVYAWLPPEIVSDFAANLPADTGSYRWAVCTCGDEAGRAMDSLTEKLRLSSAWSLQMPNNYILSFNTDPAETVRAKVKGAKQRLPRIAQDILDKKEVWDVHAGSFAGLKSSLIGPAFNRFARSDRSFHAEASCTGCGLCQKVCPADNIELRNGKPVWLGGCLKCLACIHRCPERAIEYGKATRGKGRYYFSDKLLD